jgi:hypothetical protein
MGTEINPNSYTITLHANDFAKEYDSLWTKVEGKFMPGVKQVIFSNPATIIIWTDGTKTVVKAINEPFDEEKGFAMAYLKKMYGHRNTYIKIIKKANRPEK